MRTSCGHLQGCGLCETGGELRLCGVGAVPVDGAGDDVAPVRRVAAERVAERRVVDNERRGELVVGVQELTDVAVEQPERAQHRPLEGGDVGAALPGRGVHVDDDVPGGAGLGVRQVPHLAVGVVARAEEDEVAADVGDVAVGVLGVGSSHRLGPLAGQGGLEHELAEGGVAHAGADEVRGSTDDDADLAALVCVEELGGHGGAGPALRARRVDRGGLTERPGARAVHVQVLEDDELGVC